eukprot:12190416-Heterocapsa_arctica.AAC.1
MEFESDLGRPAANVQSVRKEIPIVADCIVCRLSADCAWLQFAVELRRNMQMPLRNPPFANPCAQRNPHCGTT